MWQLCASIFPEMQAFAESCENIGAATPACNDNGCDHGDCVVDDTTDSGYICECDNLIQRDSDGAFVPFTGGEVWGGDMCDGRPVCGVCGAPGYCGPNAGCDPTVPPEPVVAQLSFAATTESVGEDGSFARQQFERGFASDMAFALSVDPSYIIVLSISPGNVVIDFAILPDANFQVSTVEGRDGGYAYDPADKLVQLTAMLSDTSAPPVFADLGAPINTPVAIPAEQQDNTLMCGLHLKRMEFCNGQTSVEDVCVNRDCLVALELAAAAATTCAGVDGFESLPSAANLGCDCSILDAYGGCTVLPADSLPNTLMSQGSDACFDATDPNDLKAAMLNFPGVSSYSLLDAEAIDTDGDVYIVPDFGAHFDGNGDRVSLDTGATYGTDSEVNGDGEGFAIGFWFTKEVCNAEDDRWEVLYHHTSDESNSADLFAYAQGASCTSDIPDGSSWTDATADPCAAIDPGVTGGEVACTAASGSVTDSSGNVNDDATVCSYSAARGTTSGIAAAVTCQSHTRPGGSTANGDIVSFRIKDDNGVNPQFDWQIGCAGSGPGLEGTWIQLILSVHPSSIRVYADGIEQDKFGFPQG
jgi:hypothetical protein